MKPELPYLAAGGLAITGGVIREGGWPPNLTRSVIGTVALVVAASASTGTRVAPLVHAVGLLFALAALMATVRAVQAKKAPPARTGMGDKPK